MYYYARESNKLSRIGLGNATALVEWIPYYQLYIYLVFEIYSVVSLYLTFAFITAALEAQMYISVLYSNSNIKLVVEKVILPNLLQL